MKRPKSINVSGVRYKILYNLDDPDAFGVTDPETSIIQLRDNLADDKLIRVFVHEITHAVIFETPFSTRRRFDVEEVCDIIGYHFLSVLRDNPEITQFLLREIKNEDGDA